MAITIRKATEMDTKFILECIQRHHELNDHYLDPLEWSQIVFGDKCISMHRLKVYLNPKWPEQDLIIVNNGNKDIGFFSQDIDMQNMILGGSNYTHPSACKMSILKVVKACVIRGALYGQKDLFDAFEFNTANALLTQVVQSIVPLDKTVKFDELYRVSYGKFSNINKYIEETEFTKRLEERFGFQLYDSNEVLFTFTDGK